jgi:hypothetical protein
MNQAQSNNRAFVVHRGMKMKSMRHLAVFLGMLALSGTAIAQGTIPSKLNGKRIYIYRDDAGHADSYTASVSLINSTANKAAYGYTVESATNPLTTANLDLLYDRLYKGPDAPKDTNTIDILILSMGEGDQNVAGGASTTPVTGYQARYNKVATHVKSGGGLILIHAAAGREISYMNWVFGAALMTDWFHDGYSSGFGISANAGHYAATTPATIALDIGTLPTADSSAYFVRRLMNLPAAQGGYNKADTANMTAGEWYHFNGNFTYEQNAGAPTTTITLGSNKVVAKAVRGNQGLPDSGIGPAKVFASLTRINGYVPPAPGRVSVWGREVTNGTFNPAASAQNGRFVYFNPGHNTNEIGTANPQVGGWARDLFLSTLRWVAKDDRGCRNPQSSNYDSLATVNAGCQGVSIRRDALLSHNGLLAGRISTDNTSITVDMDQQGAHTVRVSKIDGTNVMRKQGSGIQRYTASGLQSGLYMVRVEAGDQSYAKQVFLVR